MSEQGMQYKWLNMQVGAAWKKHNNLFQHPNMETLTWATPPFLKLVTGITWDRVNCPKLGV